MLSTGRDYLRVPKDMKSNIAWRLHVLAWCEGSAERQRAVMECCKADLFFFINTFAVQFNPNFIAGGTSLQVGPFITWEFQEKAARTILKWIADREPGVIEKSREMGASWLCLLICLWGFLFHPNTKFLTISRNADAVYKPDDADSLFWKLLFALSYFPDWMAKGRWRYSKMSLFNPLINSAITGQATTGASGIGGRCTAAFIDEFSRIKEDREIYDGMAHTTDCRIFNGTHVGTDTMFYELCDPASPVYNHIQRLQIHWTQHPDKIKGLYRCGADGRLEVLDKTYSYPENYDFIKDGQPSGGVAPGVRSPWYDKKCRGLSQHAIAMDLDIDAHASTALFFDAVLVRRLMAECRPPVWVGSLTYDKDLGKPQSLEAGDGKLSLWLNPKLDGVAPFGRYTVAADISFGTGKTPSCASIFDAAVGRKVGMYVDPWIEPGDFATLCVALSWLFVTESGEPAMLGWDGHGPCGGQFKNRVVQLGYRRIHFRQMENLLTAKSSDEPGMFYGNAKPKASLLSEYQLALKKRLLVNPDSLSLEECLSFMHDGKGGAVHKKEKSNDDPAGAGENHADRAFADALNWKLAREWAEGGRLAAQNKPPVQPNSLDWILALQTMRHRQLEEAY